MLRRLLVALALGLSVLPARAASRGGTRVFGRALDSQVVDPMHTTQNPDIWLSLNIDDTLLLASADGRGVEPGLAAAWTVLDGGKPPAKMGEAAPAAAGD